MVDMTFTMEAIELFLLVFTRVTCFLFIAPFFSIGNTPKRVKVGLGFFVAIVIFQVLPVQTLPSYETIFGYASLVIKEGIAGLLLGFGAQMTLMIISFAGRLIDTETGLAMASQFDPATKTETTLSGMIYQYAVMLILLVSGMFEYLIRALVESFTLIPVTGVVIHTEALLESMILFLGDYVILGFRIALPVFVVTTILNCILGILAKVSPQMNMFAVGIQLKVVTGLMIIFITMKLLPMVSEIIFTEVKQITVSFVEGMM